MRERYSDELNFIERALGVWRVNKDSFDTKWGYFSPKFGLSFMVNRGGYFNQNYSVDFCLGWGKFNVRLPFKTKIQESCDTPRYGFTTHENTIMFYFGGKMNEWDQCDTILKVWDVPFISWLFDFHQAKNISGEWVKFEWEDSSIYKETHVYTYKLRSGDIQKRKATCFMERRQWHRKWLPLSKMVSTCIDVSFSEEVGERTGSWKGGTTGCGYEMLEGESIEQCLRRMEREREF